MKSILEQLALGKLSEDDFPFLAEDGAGDDADAGGLRASAVGGGTPLALMPPVGGGQGDDWSFACAKKSEDGPVTQRIIIFVVGGITFSELRSVQEVKEMRGFLPEGTEVLIGGTALLTARRLIQVFWPSSNPFEDGDGAGQDGFPTGPDLT